MSLSSLHVHLLCCIRSDKRIVCASFSLCAFVSIAIIPAEAHAKIVFRLVAGQDPELVYKSLQEHVAAVAPTLAEGLRVEVKRFGPGARAYQVSHCVCLQDTSS